MTPSKTTRKTAPKKANGHKPDAIKLLKDDHDEVKALFKQYQKLVDDEADASERQPLAEQICELLTAHTEIEDEIFYPAARAALEEEDLLDEAEVEHAAAKDLIEQLLAMDADDELYDAKVTVLSEQVEHHVEEEEGELFPKCKKSDMDLVALGAELQARKDELLGEQIEPESP